MNIAINTHSVDIDGLKGFATVVFDDRYALEHITIRENKNGELYVSLPSFARPVRENGEIVMENGQPKREFISPFHPITAESRAELFTNILDAYKIQSDEALSGKSSTFRNEIAGDFKITKINANPFEKDNITGIANVTYGDMFVLQGITVKSGKNGEYLDLPSYRSKTKEKDENGNDKYEYRDMFHPISAEAQEELRTSVVNSLEAKRQANAKAQDETLSESQEQGQKVVYYC